MQGIDKIVETIIDGGKRDAEITGLETDKQITALRDKAKRELDLELKEIKNQAMQKSFERERRAATMLDVERRRSSLAVKRDLVDGSFDRSIDQLNALKDEEFVNLIVQLLITASESGDEVVIVDSDETRLDAEAIQKANGLLKEAGKKGELKLSKETRKIGGGFILQKGGVETNCSFNMLVRQVRPVIEKEVSEILFS